MGSIFIEVLEPPKITHLGDTISFLAAKRIRRRYPLPLQKTAYVSIGRKSRGCYIGKARNFMMNRDFYSPAATVAVMYKK
jgi:hypothetical protein